MSRNFNFQPVLARVHRSFSRHGKNRTSSSTPNSQLKVSFQICMPKTKFDNATSMLNVTSVRQLILFKIRPLSPFLCIYQTELLLSWIWHVLWEHESWIWNVSKANAKRPQNMAPKSKKSATSIVSAIFVNLLQQLLGLIQFLFPATCPDLQRRSPGFKNKTEWVAMLTILRLSMQCISHKREHFAATGWNVKNTLLVFQIWFISSPSVVVHFLAMQVALVSSPVSRLLGHNF